MEDFTVIRFSKNDVSIARTLVADLLGEPSVASGRLVELLNDEPITDQCIAYSLRYFILLATLLASGGLRLSVPRNWR